MSKTKYADSTLKSWTKDELIRQIRVLERNNAAQKEFNDNQAKLLEKWAPVVHGKWNGWHGDKMVDEETQRKYRYYECSECRRRSAVKTRFCPNCGAKMDEEDC